MSLSMSMLYPERQIANTTLLVQADTQNHRNLEMKVKDYSVHTLCTVSYAD